MPPELIMLFLAVELVCGSRFARKTIASARFFARLSVLLLSRCKVLRLPGFDHLGSSGCWFYGFAFTIYRYGRSAEPDSVLFLHSTMVSPPFLFVQDD